MIPKIIHQIWLGTHRPAPNNYIETWRQFCRLHGFEHRLWTEKEIMALDFPGKNLFIMAWNENNVHGASDIARMGILFQLGGFYFDCDMVWPGQGWAWDMVLGGLIENSDAWLTTEHDPHPPQQIKYPDAPGVPRVRSAVYLCIGFMGFSIGNPITSTYVHGIQEMVELNDNKITAETAGCYFLTWCAQCSPFTLIPMRWIFPPHWAGHDTFSISRYIEGYRFNDDVPGHVGPEWVAKVWDESEKAKGGKSKE